jgi:hypothetical protein
MRSITVWACEHGLLDLTGFYSSPNLVLQFPDFFRDCLEERDPLLPVLGNCTAIFGVHDRQEVLKRIDNLA